jgi:hypothetical protein
MTSRSPGAPAGEPNSGNRGLLLLNEVYGILKEQTR